jgi:Restriction endonuclease
MPTIFEGGPKDWEDLEEKVCQIFREAGCLAARRRTLKTVRGHVDIDVVVDDTTRRPHALILCECKNWNRRVPRTIVHAFRTVVQDTGATLGFIISERGFQRGAKAAAEKSNVRLVTWKEFQEEMYDRWFEVQEARLTLLADELYAISEIPTEDKRTLMSEAVNEGGERVWNELQLLKQRYVQLAFASSSVAAGAIRRFPYKGLDPRAEKQKGIVFKTARMYFDIMFEAAPRAMAEYVEFILKHTGGRGGSAALFDEAAIGQVVEGKTTHQDVHRLFGYRGMIHVIPGGEIWTLRGSITRFKKPHRNARIWRLTRPVTACRTLVIEFGSNEVARRVTIENF